MAILASRWTHPRYTSVLDRLIIFGSLWKDFVTLLRPACTNRMVQLSLALVLGTPWWGPDLQINCCCCWWCRCDFLVLQGLWWSQEVIQNTARLHAKQCWTDVTDQTANFWNFLTLEPSLQFFDVAKRQHVMFQSSASLFPSQHTTNKWKPNDSNPDNLLQQLPFCFYILQ